MNKMEKLLLGFGFFCVGVSFATFIFSLSSQSTTVTITKDGIYTNYNFRNNRFENGDTYFIIKNGDTLSSGIVVNRKWK